uniref:Exg1 n=1 Tax=Arundo donax TaxID=35708 RepID=A0A0A9CLX9_ARUDO
MDGHQPTSVDDCVVLVDSHVSPTITNIVLCACSNVLTSSNIWSSNGIRRNIPLQARNE